MNTTEYKEKVLDNIEKNVKTYVPVYAGFFERHLKRKLNIKKLHPNPEDEFSIPAIGPNDGIVSNYEKTFRRLISLKQLNDMEKLIVQKLSSNEYMLLNGHHRWLAATRISEIKKLPVEIVNPTNEAYILEQMNKSESTICVSFDMDEVILTDGSIIPVERKLPLIYRKIYARTLRKASPFLINELTKKGYDVWFYTGEYYSDLYLNLLLKHNGCSVRGIVNGIGHKKTTKSSRFKESFKKKYTYSLHIDNEGIVCVNNKTKSYDSIEINHDNVNWSKNVLDAINSIDLSE